MRPRYITREHVQRATSNMYDPMLIDGMIVSASMAAEDWLHRIFYPRVGVALLDWPTAANNDAYRFDLGINELISVTRVVSGGTDVPLTDIILRREDDIDSPPYGILELRVGSNYCLQASPNGQQSLSITGKFGYNDTTNSTGAVLSGAITDSDEQLSITPFNNRVDIGVGSLILIDDEYMIVYGNRYDDTGATLSAGMSAAKGGTTLLIDDTTAIAVNETIIVDSERMYITAITGSTVTVRRATEGTTLAGHLANSVVYAARTFLVSREACGSTSVVHADATGIRVHEFNYLLQELVTALVIVALSQSLAEYGKTVGTGTMTRESSGKGLQEIQERVYWALGRMERGGAI